MIFLNAPCAIEIVRDGSNFIVRGRKEEAAAVEIFPNAAV